MSPRTPPPPRPRSPRLRIIIGGFLGLLPAGGVTWDYLQYPLGFHELGHDVYYLEDTGLWPVYQHSSAAGDATANVRHLAAVMSAFGLEDRWAYRDEVTGRWHGLNESQIADLCRTADAFLNVSCSTVLRDRYHDVPSRVLIDTDPMFTQIQCQTAEGFTGGLRGMRDLLAGHTHHFTFGESVGRADCLIPDCGLRWRATRQPVCLDHWPVTPLPQTAGASFTTVMNWAAGRPLEYAGRAWGQKDLTFQRIADLPAIAPWAPLAMAVGQTGGAACPHQELADAGWRILDPEQCAGDWRSYRDFIQQSLGEFSVAKQTYVDARTGWFSCRSACYLASGRPVILQDTGWSDHLPAGEGLLTFVDSDSAADALKQVMADPTRHAAAARRTAVESFDARQVLTDLLGQL